MIAIVLIGVMADRPALTFRTLTIAAFGVLLIAPQAIVHPSFQMSFAATLALIAAYQYGLPWRAKADTSLVARAALWGAREIVGLILASLVAGLATTPYAAYHFHRVAPYGVLANLLAMPVVSAWVMPMGILGVLTMPFGFDATFWRLMGEGIDWMIACRAVGGQLARRGRPCPRIRHRTAAAGDRRPAAALPAAHAAALDGAVLMLAAALWALPTPRPDVLVAGDGEAAAMRGPDGRLSVLASSRDTFAIKEWLAADGDARDVKERACATALPAMPTAASASSPTAGSPPWRSAIEAFAEDCARAAVVVSARAGATPLRRPAGRPQCLARPRRHGAALDRRRVSRRPLRARRAMTGPGRRRCARLRRGQRSARRDAEAGKP